MRDLECRLFSGRLLQGRPSPTCRLSFTTWRLWGKDDKLVPAGLLGPVKVVFLSAARS